MADVAKDQAADPKLPSAEELLAAVDKLADIDEEGKESLRRNILEKVASGGDVFGREAKAGPFSEAVYLLTLIGLVLLVLAFFGYKLYKSLVEKERRREEKRKLKLQKKKK